MNTLIKCSCGNRFPINTKKHPSRDRVFCPSCRMPHEVTRSKEWRPNKEYWENRTTSRTFTIRDFKKSLERLFRERMKRR